MHLASLANLINLLDLERASLYAVATLALGAFIIFYDFSKAPQEISGSVDFPAFYNAGRIINEFPPARLYDRALQHRFYLEIAPNSAEDRYFAYAPFFAIFFSPLSRLSFPIAFTCWVIISLGFFVAGFGFAWSGLPTEYRARSFAIAVSFLPFYSWCLLAGQVSAFGFFWLALSLYLDKNHRFASGCALAMLLYKPTLLILLLPMLLVTQRWRTLLGFALAASTLVALSLAVVGFSGIGSYLDMLRFFAEAKASGRLTRLEVDIFAFFSLFVGRGLAVWLGLGLAILITPMLILTWRRQPETAWAHAITWTLILNFYVLIYDTTLLILSVIIFVSMFKLRLPRAFRWLLLLLFLVAWAEVDIVRLLGVQIMSLVLITFGCYQLYVSRSILLND
jgi:hypothetical protein